METDASPPEGIGKASAAADGRSLAQYPAPYLDVFTIHSRRLLHKTREEIAATERGRNPLRPDPGANGRDPGSEDEEAARLEELVASVRLLLEPIHLPDLIHTGLVAESVGKPHQGDDVPLFYPTGAKNANMREFIRETLDKHQLLRGVKSTADLTDAEPSSSALLAASASTPAIAATSSASKAKSTATSKRKTRKAAVYSPVRAAMSPPGALLDRELTRQAKDVIAALRANSSKINELIAK